MSASAHLARLGAPGRPAGGVAIAEARAVITIGAPFEAPHVLGLFKDQLATIATMMLRPSGHSSRKCLK